MRQAKLGIAQVEHLLNIIRATRAHDTVEGACYSWGCIFSSHFKVKTKKGKNWTLIKPVWAKLDRLTLARAEYKLNPLIFRFKHFQLLTVCMHLLLLKCMLGLASWEIFLSCSSVLYHWKNVNFGCCLHNFESAEIILFFFNLSIY